MSAAIQAPPHVERPCRLVAWTPWPGTNSSLIGHVTINFSGWIVHRVPVFRRGDGGLRVGAPSVPEIDTEGRIKRDRDGKRVYASVLTFEGADARARWQSAVLSALAAAGISAGEMQP